MLEPLQELIPTTFPVPSSYEDQMEYAWYFLVLARHTEWRNSPETRDLEQALERFVSYSYPLLAVCL